MKQRKIRIDFKNWMYILMVLILALCTVFHAQAKAVNDTMSGWIEKNLLNSEKYQKEEIPVKSNASGIPMYGYQKSVSARNSITQEMYSFNIAETPYHYYTKSGTFYNQYDEPVFSVDTFIPGSAESSDYERALNQVCAYLYGDSDSVNTLHSYNYLMRFSENSSNDSMAFPEGNDIHLTLDTFRERQIYELFRINGIKGGCIVQNLETGAIEVMTATSVTSAESSKSKLTQLEACLNPEPLFSSVSESELLQSYFDYKYYMTQVIVPETGTTPEHPQTRYCFFTDFDVVEESDIEASVSLISPLHMNTITQRIFSKVRTMPTLRKDSTQEAEPLENEELLSYLQSLYVTYTPEKKGDASLLVLEHTSERDFYYATGVVHTADGDKAFTLYGRDNIISKFIECISVIYGENGAVRKAVAD